MNEYVATRNFLVRQEDAKHPKTGARIKRDIKAKKGEKIKLSEKEAIIFWGGLDLNEETQKRLLKIAKAEGFKRKI